MKQRKYPKSVKFDYEVHELWEYLRSVRISPASLIHDHVKEILRNKATEMKKPKDEFIYPF